MIKAKRGISYKWVVMSVIAMGTYLGTSDQGAVSITLPHLGHVFQEGADALVWIMLGPMLIGTGLLLAMGQASDAFGRKRLFTLSVAVLSLGMGLCALAQNLVQLVLFRLIQWVGVAMNMSMAYAIITDSFPHEERGRALGLFNAVEGVGLISGPVLGGFLLDLLGWRSVFYIRLPIGIIGTIMAWALLREPVSSKQAGKFDLLGAVTLFLTLTLLLLAVNRGQSLGWLSPWIVGLFIIGALLLFFFVVVEQRAVQPVLDLGLFRNRLFSFASASQILLPVSAAAVGLLMPFYLIQGLGFSTSKAGLLLLTTHAVSLVLAPLSGRLSDRLGTLFLCTSGVTLVAVALFLLGNLGADPSVGRLVLCLIILGMGTGLFMAPNTSAIMGAVPKERLGTASGMVGMLRMVGTSIGLTIAGSVFTASQLLHATQLASQGLLEEVVQKLSTVSGFHDAIFVSLTITALGFVTVVLRGRR